MLIIMLANINIATQEIIAKAEELDPDSIRTLGLLTKPDLVDKGAKKNVINLLQGRNHQLILGWHVLHNASQTELDKRVADRDATESRSFKGQSPWNNLDKTERILPPSGTICRIFSLITLVKSSLR